MGNLRNTAFEHLQNNIQNLPGWKLRQAYKAKKTQSIIILKSPDGIMVQLHVVEVQHLDPAQVLSLSHRLTSSPTLVTAPFLSPLTQKRLSGSGIHYADATGNCRLVISRPAIVLQTTGASRDPNRRPDRRVQSLKGAVAGRVIRCLCDFKAPIGIRQLAIRANTTPGYVSKLMDILGAEELVKRSQEGAVKSVAWIELIHRWCQDYSLIKSNQATMFLEPRGLKAFLSKLKEANIPHALTGSLAATHLAPIAEPRLGVCFVEDVAIAANCLKLRQASTGANIMLLEPFDPIVFERTWIQDDLHFASPSQIAADLLTSPGRGPEEALELLTWMEKNQRAWRQ